MIQRLNPPGLSTPTGYTHVVSATGGRTIYISGQVALDAQANSWDTTISPPGRPSAMS